ncbi:HTH-type transcriptional regulatory protein gabR [uncultured Flavonifractor sp.]|uniref:PLP-dependent aminotransferase family protein n=1 Tax=Flintibacter hominis TaxID=2763048 RepID=A0A8J6J784_9FIRM|nr:MULTISPECIES: PLP-dependent aminotransferase family protein [Eubacteriales]MBS5591169.1 PLP-dependent aminotransferase family protein [Clostridiales bacterium]SCH47209.1 HTH-type transcriptional regulatory protein gabR [uncultured Clostridium sp.]SCI58218.1 HTH-type transcriptional regulatory protein gabR [uncultured Flavonifractor sp.]MBC5721770.1 PLP-dependent aminotransferase family protein [Flintibacter hominis]MCH1979418.1 PLP-dependent aminotransferase family protein [Lawsonibacter sp
MLTYDLEKRGSLARYDYLYRCIKEDILSGRLKAGEKLPSKRTLATHLNTAVVTVENAYAQLEAEGYLNAREKRGYFVNPVETGPVRENPAEAREKNREQREWRLDLRGTGSGTEGFPFSVWARLMRRILTERGAELLQATPHNGVYPLRQAIARHLYQFRGISAAPEQIVVGAGTEYLYNLIVQLLGRDLLYGVEDPGYSKAARIYGLNGAGCIPLPMDSRGVRPQEVEERGVQILHISPNHQFPTGTVTPILRRQALLRWAEEQRGYIIEDDYDSEFRFTGRPIPAMKSIDAAGRVIYMNTFSRSLAPSLRVSYMVLPPSLMEEYPRRLGFYSCTVPAMEQYTLASFLEEGYFESHVNRMRVFYRNRRDEVLAAIGQSPLSGRCRVLGEEAGLHFLLELETEREDSWLSREMEARGVRLSFLTDYQQRPGAAPLHTLVVNYPGTAPARLAPALALLAGLLD